MGKKFESFEDLKKSLQNKQSQTEATPGEVKVLPTKKVSRPEPSKKAHNNSVRNPHRGKASRGNTSSSPSAGPSRHSVYRVGVQPNAASIRASNANGSTPKQRTAQRIEAAGSLRIASANAESFTPYGVLAETEPLTEVDADVVIVGLDFGTAFTKVVVSWMGDRGVVDWGRDSNGSPLFWVPSTFRRGDQGLQLGNQVRRDGNDVNAIKVRLIASEESATEDAVLYLTLVLRHVVGWTQRWVAERRGAVSGWVLNVGFPAKSLQDQMLVKRYQSISERAWSSATSIQGTHKAWVVPQVHVIPEFAAQLYGYLKDPHKARDTHLLVDVGAGTVDLVAFIPHVDSKGRNVSPILSSNVVTLGMHRLFAARVGAMGRTVSWVENDVLLSDASLAAASGDRAIVIKDATDDFRVVLSGYIRALLSGAKHNNPLCLNLKALGAVPTFLSGGGAHADFYKSLVARADDRIRTRSLPEPEDLHWSGDKSDFHRISVAYGLSFSSRNIGKIINTADLVPIPRPKKRDFGDRDDTR